MQHKRIKIFAILLSGLGMTGLHAQESINATGSNASGSGGSISYSIGQVFYTTNTGMNGFAAQGVQQPYEISVVTAIEATHGIDLSVLAYPNPTTDLLQLKVDASTSFGIQSMYYQLYDMNGKLLQNKRLRENEVQIDMSNYVSSIYFIRIIFDRRTIKEFKIIKK